VIVQTAADLVKVSDLLDKSDIWTFDIETTGLNPRQDSIIGFSGASDAGSFYVILKAYENGVLNDTINIADARFLIQQLEKRALVTHNGSFDTRFIYHSCGSIELWNSLCADTMLMAHCVNENRFTYGLKELGAEILGRDVTKEKEAMLESIKSNGGTATEYYKASSQLMAEYGRKDAEMTWQLYKHFKSELEHQGLTQFFQDEYMELYKLVTIPMELKGVPVDIPALQSAQVEINADMQALEDQIQEQIKPLLGNFHDWYISRHYPFKFSPAFKSELIRQLGVDSWPRTKSGGFTFAKVDLDRAVKKGLINPQSEAYLIATQQIKPSPELIKQVQLALLAEEGVRYPFNLLSTDHLKRLFFKSSGAMLDERALSFTDKGAPQINDEFLETMANKYTWASLLQTYRSLSKLRGTYIDGILERSEDGIFYPQFFQHRTVSGRYGSNLQQLPRPMEEGSGEHPLVLKYTNMVRKFFVAGPGHMFVDDDYESLEPHIFAHVSGDEGLRNIFRRNHDFYSTIAIDTERLSGVSPDKAAETYLGRINKAARQKAKAYSLGIPYGMSGYKLAFELGIPQSEAEKLVKQYLGAYPDLAKWMKQSREFACTYGYIKTLSGRMRRFPELPGLYKKYGTLLFDSLELWKEYNESPREYEQAKRMARLAKNAINNASNVQIQGYAASIVNKASILITKEFKRLNLSAYICASIHDEIIVRCEEKDVDTVKQIVQYNMENCVSLSVQLKAPASAGYTFADAKGA